MSTDTSSSTNTSTTSTTPVVATPAPTSSTETKASDSSSSGKIKKPRKARVSPLGPIIGGVDAGRPKRICKEVVRDGMVKTVPTVRKKSDKPKVAKTPKPKAKGKTKVAPGTA